MPGVDTILHSLETTFFLFFLHFLVLQLLNCLLELCFLLCDLFVLESQFLGFVFCDLLFSEPLLFSFLLDELGFFAKELLPVRPRRVSTV